MKNPEPITEQSTIINGVILTDLALEQPKVIRRTITGS